MHNIPTKIITHHAVSLKTHTAQDVQDWHRSRWNKYNPSPFFRAENGEPYYVGYHYIIEWDGTLVQCREHSEQGVHSKGQNFSSIGVCFMGNFDEYYPSIHQMKTWKRLRSELFVDIPAISANAIYPHRKYAVKSCHGKLLSDDYFSQGLHNEAASVEKQLRIALIALISRLRSRIGDRMK